MSGKSDAENKCVADFFQFLTSPEIQKFYHQATGYVAITKAAYELAKAEGYYKEKPLAEVGIQQLIAAVGRMVQGLPPRLLPADPRRHGTRIRPHLRR